MTIRPRTRARRVLVSLLGAVALVGSGVAVAASGYGRPGGAAAKEPTWTSYGHDFANTRLNADERQVTAATVSRLTPRWSKDGLVGVVGTPAVRDGTAYFGDWQGTVWALDVETGAERWHASIAGGSIVAAPAVTDTAVFIGNGRTLYRLDRATGAVVWQAVTDPHPQAQISASPVVVDGLVLQGVASFENVVKKDQYTFRGSIAAYDARTGASRWQLFTTPADATAGAGSGIWSTPAIDRKRGLLFVGTGQSLAEPTAPLADSLLAVHYRTGELAWSRRFTYPDVFSAAHPGGKDADVGASPNLWRARGRDLVGAGDKGGTFHALDRRNGKVVWESTLTPGSVFGGQIGSSALVDGRLIATSNVGDPDTNAATDVTRVFALDPGDGDVEWSTELPGKVFAPVSAVPGVAFVGTDRGTMAALATRSGRRLWTFQAPDKTASGPAIVDGRVLWGYGFVLFRGAGAGGVISFAVEP